MFKEIANIDILDTNDELRSTYDILADLAAVSDTLTSKERQRIYEAAAGNRQVSVLTAIIKNWDDVSKAVDKATNSTGSAMKENEKFLDSIQGKTNRLASSFQMLANNTIESGAIKGLIDFANALVQVIDKIGPLQTALLTITGFTTLFSNGKLAGTVASLGKSFLNMGKTFLMLPKTIKQSNENFIGPMQAGASTISSFRLAVLGVTAAFTVAKVALDAYDNSLAEHAQRAQDAVSKWEDTNNTLADTKQAIESIGPEFEKLSSGVDTYGNNISLTSEQFDRYNQIANQVASMFPEMVVGYTDQGTAILSTAGYVSELTDAYEKQEIAARRASAAGANVVFEAFRRRTSTGDLLGRGEVPLERERDIAKAIMDASDSGARVITQRSLVNEMGRAGTSGNYSDAALKNVIEGANLKTVSPGSYEIDNKWLKENSGSISSYLDAINSQLESETNTLKPFIENIIFGTKRYQGLTDDAKQAVSNIIDELGYEYYSQFSNDKDASAGIIQDMLVPLDGESALIKGIGIIEEASANFKDGKKSVGEYTAAWAEFQSLISNSNLKPAIAEAITSTYDIGSIEPLIANVKKKLPAELSDMVGELSNRQLQIAGKMEIDPATITSWQEFLALINQASAVMSSLTIGERLAAIASAASVANSAFSEQGYSAAVTKEQYDELAKAGEEYVSVIDNTNGYLSINKQKLDALIASKRQEEKANIAIAKAAKLQEFEKNAEVMRMNTLQLDTLTGMTDEYKQSVLDKNAALLSSQEAILAEVNNLDLQASALEYATSAYKRWLGAKNAPEAGDMYDETFNAWEAIDKGLESGKIGTNEFASASDWLIPKEVSDDGVAAIAKYKKSVMKYFTEDASGANKFIDSLMAGGFMEQLSDGSYATTAKANVEKIAKSLNLTEGAVESLFLVLKDYGWNVELNDGAYETTAAAQELAKATKDVADAQEALNKARSSGASKEEIAKRESELKAAQDEAQRLASQSPVEVPVELTLEEQYAKKIESLETLIAEAGNLKMPVELVIEAKEEVDKLRGFVKAITDAEAIVVEAKVTGDTTEIETALSNLTTPSEDDPNYEVLVKINAHLTDMYNAAIDHIKNLEESPPEATVTVKDNGTAKAVGDGIDAIVKDREVTITVNDKKLSEAEERLAKLQADMDKYDLEGKDPPLSVLHSGTGNKATAEEIVDFWATRVDPDQEEVRLLDTLNEAEKKANEVRTTLREATALALKEELPKFETVDQQAEYLQKKIADLEKVRENLKVVGFDLTSAEEGKLDAYKAALAEISTPITTPVSLETSGALESANNLEKAIESKNPTMTVDVKYSDGSGGNFVPKVDMKYAKGTQKAKKGVALTGEEGVETVITKDGFYTVGHDGPELVNLRGGEEILNDEETKKLFKGSKQNMFGQAFAGGTGFFANLVSGIKTLAKKVVDTVKVIKPPTTTDARGNNRPGGSNNKGGGSSSPAPVEEAKEEIKTDFEDWIPRLLDNVRKETDRLLASAEKQISYQSQNTEIEKALANNTKLMDLNSQATNRYLQQAAQVGLSGDLISKVQNGSIDIALYDENTRKLIADYQKWYDLAQKTKDTITSLQEEQRKLAMSKLDNVQGYYENRIGVYGNRLDIANSTIELGQATGREIKRQDYNSMISDVNAQLALLRQEKAEYEKTFAGLVTSGVIKEGSNDWYQYTAKIDDMQKSILQASLSLDEFNDVADAIAVNNLNVAIKYLNTVQGTLESVQGLRQAQGKELTAVDYEQLISVGMQQVSALQAQNLELLRQQEGLDVLSDAYQEIQDQINDNLNGIWNIKTSQEGWNDAIADLNINAIKKVNDQYNRQLETMRAIEELEKAKQRRNLVFREGRGFVYEADQGALRDAQRTVDQINVDNLISYLEDAKANDNVYDNAGNLLGKLFTGLDGVDFSGYLQSAGSGNETSALLANAIKSIDWNSIRTASGASTSVEFSGGINLYGVDNVQALAKDIKYRLGGYVTQGLYNND